MNGLIAFTAASPVSAALFAGILAASLIGLYSAPRMIERNLFRPYWWLRRGEYATPVTSAFLHGDLAHLIFNGFTFWSFAFPLERAMGSAKFAALYASGIAISSLGTWLRHRRDPNYRCLGASGAILAVLFAAIVYVPQASIFMFPIPVPVPAPVFALLYLGYTVWAARRAPAGVAHDAHLAGALAGIAFVAVVDPAALARALRYVAGYVTG